MFKELSYDELKNIYDDFEFEFKSTEDMEVSDSIIGQQKAVEALEFGLNVKSKGYNIFVSGIKGTGKTTFAEAFAKKIAKKEKAPDDVCYVYNFDNPKAPKFLKFKAGTGKIFKEEIDDIVYQLSIEIPKAYNSADYEEEKEKIVRDYQDRRDEIIKQMTDEAKENGFGAKMTNTGMYFMPIIDGVTISEEEFDNLDEDKKEEISKSSETVQERAADVMRQIKEFEKETKKEIDEIEYNIGLFTVGYYLNNVQEKYSCNEEVSKYLMAVKEDILNNIEDFIEDENDDDENMQLMIPWISKKTAEDSLAKYRINLIVDNSDLEGAPVIVDFNPTYSNLIGEIEYDNEYGNFTTDFMKIKPGLLHKANGGYLILQVSDLISNSYAWETLRRVLKTNEILIEPIKEYQLGGIAVSTIKPQPLDVNVKVILVGSNYYFEILSEYDEEFLKLFKIYSMFDYEMDNSKENIRNIAQFVKNFAVKEKTLPFDISAIREVIKHSARLAERKDRLTTRFSQLNEVLAEANTWARLENAESVDRNYIRKAIEKKNRFCNLYEEKLNNMIIENEIMIDTEGAKVGQINGLAVLETGTASFGKPSRITATTYMGKSGIVNIEKEAELSGSIHDKGVQVLNGYLGATYAQEFPLSLSCRVCFEQNYNGVDGDSASSTELYAILSSLSNLPLRQDIAVTGSVNQRGEIQPIGGVIYKIEGFFDICYKRGLTGTQGVIIPIQNVKDLVLKDEVLTAIKDKKFHIYPVASIDEGIEILTGVKAGSRSAKGKYNVSSVHGKVMKKLKYFYNKSIEEE